MFAPSIAFRAEQLPLTQRDEFVNDTHTGMQILETLVSELNRAGFEARRIANVELAFTEALINAVRHGNQSDPRKSVRIRYRVDSAGLWLSIEDEGRGFRTDEVADPRLPENWSRPGGRGLLLMKSAMSHVEFNEQGNHVVMRLLKHAA